MKSVKLAIPNQGIKVDGNKIYVPCLKIQLDIYFNKNFEKCPIEGCFIDIQGFDLIKFSKMLASSNPTVIEWLNSKILYSGERPSEFVRFSRDLFNFKSLYYHYKSMGKQNYLKYIKPQTATPKKYLYTCRGILNAIYVKEFLELPPINFLETLSKLYKGDFIKEEILTILIKIIDNKKSQKEFHKIDNINILDDFIETQLKIDEVPDKRGYCLPDYFNDVINPLIHHKGYTWIGVDIARSEGGGGD